MDSSKERISLNVIHNEHKLIKERFEMKKFDIPQMDLIRLESKSIIFTSLCSSKYCDGHQCRECEKDDTTCYSVSDCGLHNCGHVLCTSYIG